MRLDNVDARHSSPRRGTFENSGLTFSKEIGLYANNVVPERKEPVTATILTSIVTALE